MPGLPGLTATVFDLPQVTDFAARKTAAGISRPDANIRLLRQVASSESRAPGIPGSPAAYAPGDGLTRH